MKKITKVIFLDIDGVVTSVRTGWYNLDIYTVNFLIWVCKKTGAKIVISSTWRYNHGNKFWQSIFKDVMHEDYKTPNFYHERDYKEQEATRGKEINEWLLVHTEVKKYLILDDDSDMLEHQKPSFIKTNSMNGLLFEQMDKIRNYFKIKEYPREQKKLYQHKNMFSEFNTKRPLIKK